MKQTLSIAFSLLILSCQNNTKAEYGITEPQVEDEKSIVAYLEDVNMKTDNVYSLNFNDFMKEMEKGVGIPEVVIFNRKGEYIPYGNDPACNGGAFDFIKKLDRDSTYTIDSSKNMDVTLKTMTTLKGEKAAVERNSSIDFYVFIYWAKYGGKLNEDHVKIWEDSALANKEATLKTIKVNMDHQEAWGKNNLAKLGH